MTNPTGPDDPGAQDECATCGHARWRHKTVDGQQVCTEYVHCACGGHFAELSQATRMGRVIEAAGTLAEQFATFRASLQGAMQSLHALHHAMKVAGLLPEDDQPQQATGRHDADAIERARQQGIERIAGALDIPQALITGPSPDGLPDHWGDAARIAFQPAGRAAGKASMMVNSCATCWPRICDPERAMCQRNPNVAQTMPAVTTQAKEPMLCDACGRTDQPVTATDDGRALACPNCLPTANANITRDTADQT